MFFLLEEFRVFEAGKILWDLMLTLSFFIGIFLIASREAVECLNRDFQKEFGWRKYILPQLEGKKFMFLDAFIMKYPVWIGLIISVASFVMLLLGRGISAV